MSISLYDASVSNYLQILGSVSGVVAKGAAYAEESGKDPSELLETRLNPDMLPLSFQINSVCHHSMGTITGMRAGVFGPPPSLELDYPGMQALIQDSINGLQSLTREEIGEFEGKTITFKMGDFEMPFSTENFVLSFSLPNFYFHATTTYDILRMVGVPLGKMDFLGEMRMGA